MSCLAIQVKAPQITHFELPLQIWTTGSLLLFLIYTTSVPEHTTSNFWWLARTLRYHVFPAALFTAVWAFVGVVHASEGVYAATLARKHHMPWHIAVRCLLPFRQFHSPNLFFFFLKFVVAEPDVGFLADGLGRLHHAFRRPRADEAAASYQTSADRLYYEGSLIGWFLGKWGSNIHDFQGEYWVFCKICGRCDTRVVHVRLCARMQVSL